MIPVVERLLALLAIVAAVVAAAGAIALVARRVPAWLRDEAALPTAAAIAVVATAGSLFASEIAGYPPCRLCWYQRGAMYPLAAVLVWAALTHRRGVWRLTLPVSLVGAAIATWHVVIERVPGAPGAACTDEAPCSVRWIEELGIFTLPSMALIGFLAIAVLSLVVGLPSRVAPGAAPGTDAHGRPGAGRERP